MAKRGRKPFEFTDAVLEQIEQHAAQGLEHKQIARIIGIHPNTFSTKVHEIHELNEAIKRGKAKGVATIANSLFKSARNGNITAQIFFLKNRDPDNWKDRHHIDETRRTVYTANEIDDKMTPQEAADSYADTLKLDPSTNVVPLKRRSK